MADFTAEQLTLIQKMYEIAGPDLELFLYTCKRTGLDPLARQIYAIQRGGKMTIQTGIDGYRVIADRTGKLAGISDYLFDSEDKQFPAKATVTVRKLMDGGILGDFTATARWGEYQAGGPMWKKMPYLMLGKCAEALALRKAFPADLSGVYTTEEMAQADNPAADAVFAEVERQQRAFIPDNLPGAALVGSQSPQNAPQAILPPEPTSSFNKASGLLLGRIVDVAKKSAKNGRDYLILQFDVELEKGKKPIAFYWHETHRDALLAAKGKMIKALVEFDGKGFRVESVTEIDYHKLEAEALPPVAGIKPVGDPETQARLLASVLDIFEDDLQGLLKLSKNNWQNALEFLQREQARREVTA